MQTIESDAVTVLSWRLHVLLDAGADIRSAEKLAASEVDLHEAVELIKQGCSPEIAARILL
jgi:hypothetical protein